MFFRLRLLFRGQRVVIFLRLVEKVGSVSSCEKESWRGLVNIRKWRLLAFITCFCFPRQFCMSPTSRCICRPLITPKPTRNSLSCPLSRLTFTCSQAKGALPRIAPRSPGVSFGCMLQSAVSPRAAVPVRYIRSMHESEAPVIHAAAPHGTTAHARPADASRRAPPICLAWPRDA